MQGSDIQEKIRVEKQRRFIRAMSKSIDGQPVTQSDAALLDALCEALLHGKDVSDLIGVNPPHTRRSADRVYVALHYLCLTKLLHEPAAVAWHKVGEAWGLKQRVVRWIIADNWVPASAMMRQTDADPAALLQVCERHARGDRPGRRSVGREPSTPAAGGPTGVA